MRVDLFDFVLPQDSIATTPASPRDSARMLYIGDTLRDMRVKDIPSLLQPGDVMVFNDTRVIPARLFGKRGDLPVEVLLHKPFGSKKEWLCFAKPAKRLKPGQIIQFADDFSAIVGERVEEQLKITFTCDDVFAMLDQYGEMPLPPYMHRRAGIDDKSTYQTAYAKDPGSVAAPTAGLHFTPELLKAIDDAGAKRVHVTLHVGAGTFLPVKVDDTDDHTMHSEWVRITSDAAETINNAHRVIAVGTTSCRTLESMTVNGRLQAGERETDIFITPGYEFKCVDVLMTNFHLPRSTLLMLVSAFAGRARMLDAYAHAIQNGYRFYSYGDACWLEKNSSIS